MANFWQRMTNKLSLPFSVKFAEHEDKIQDQSHDNTQISFDPIGASGTEVHSGFFTEEYLQELLDTEGADIWDKMRRNDARVKMALKAVKNPIRRANWEIHPAKDMAGNTKSSDEAKFMAEFIEFNLFEDMRKSWVEHLIEADSVVDFGHVVFEEVHKVVKDHKKFGTYIGLANLAFRSQRTIERWNVDRVGHLLNVEQFAFGDVGDNVTIPGEFILTYALDKEGDNYPGISMLRPCFGAWKRKQLYLKLNAIGIEKFAVPTILGETPDMKPNSKQYQNFKEALKKYTTHESNYIIYPKGWTVTAHNNIYDPSKVLDAIKFENTEIVFAFLANFLDLGQSQSGSYAMSTDLSDFFLSGIEHIAFLIAEKHNKVTIRKLIDKNFGPQAVYPTLVVSGIADKVGKEFAGILKTLSDGNIIVPDDDLEIHIRNRYSLPDKSDEGQRGQAAINDDKKGSTNNNTGKLDKNESPEDVENGTQNNELNKKEDESTQLAESKKKDNIQLAEAKTAKTLITIYKGRTKELMRGELKKISTALVNQVMRNFNKLPSSNKLAATKNVKSKNVNGYKKLVQTLMAEAANDALKMARRQIPAAQNVKLQESPDPRDLPVLMAALPKSVRDQIKTQSDQIIDKQIGDLEGATFLQLGSTLRATEDARIIADDMTQAANSFIGGASTEAASGNLPAFTINESQNSFFFETEVLNEVQSFTFTNDDPKSEICQNLTGKTFRANDPSASRFYPPLHHNCKSFLVPNLKGTRQPDLTPGGLTPTGTPIQVEKALKSIKFSEHLELEQNTEHLSSHTIEPNLEPEDFIGNPSGPHTHLDANGEELGPTVSDGLLHYHEKKGGGRVESAPGVKGHAHRDGNMGATGADISLEQQDQTPVKEDPRPETALVSIFISKGLHNSAHLAKIEAERFSPVTEMNEDQFLFKFARRDRNLFIEHSFIAVKPKLGVTLVFGRLK